MGAIKFVLSLVMCCLVYASTASSALAAPATRLPAVEIVPAESPASDAAASMGITVFAATSLREAFTAIRREFMIVNPGIQVRINFAGSDYLLQKIQWGAEVDVFASADQFTMDAAEVADLLEVESRKNFAVNSLVLVVPTKGNFVDVRGLSKNTIRHIAMGNPQTTSVGRYSQSVLENMNLWERLQSKLVTAESVRQVLDYVIRGQVNAGLVYGSDAHLAQDRVKVTDVLHTQNPVLYAVAVTRGSQHKAEAQAFLAFVCSKKGQALLLKSGFQMVEAK